MRRIFLILIVLGFQNTFGQISSVDYEIYSDILLQLEKNRTKDRFLVSDSTTPFVIELADIDKYFHNKTDKNLKIAQTSFPYYDLLNLMWVDTAVYTLIVAHNRINKTANPVMQSFPKRIAVDILDSKNNGNWDSIYKLYPTSGGVRTFSRPAIIRDRAAVILTTMQSGNAGETILLLTRKTKDKWIIEKSIVLGGD